MPSTPTSRLFKRGDYLAVMADVDADEDPFWICKVYSKSVSMSHSRFDVRWCERTDQDGVYNKPRGVNSIELDSVLRKVTLLRREDSKYDLPEKERLKILKVIEQINNGHIIVLYDEGGTIRDKMQVEDPNEKRKEKEEAATRRKKAVAKKPAAAAKRDGKKKAPKKEKVPKPKVDKSNPNWRLKPNDNIPVWEKDPLFETKEKVPFVSTTTHR